MGFHTLSIGSSALLTARYGLDVTGQNLGNIDTPGYSRQRLNQAATKGWNGGLGNAVLGNGVWTVSVSRIANEYVEKQLRQATSTDEYYGNLQNCYTNIQTFFNELSGNAISDSINTFWKAMSNFSTHVENLSIRSTAIEEAQQMTQRFNSMSNMLLDYRKDVNNEITESVTQINRLLHTIAELNQTIVKTELGGSSNRSANDLRDQRGEAVKELYEYMDIDVVEESNGSFIISMQGRNLVYYDNVKEISIEKRQDEDGVMVNMPVFSSDGYPLKPTNGQLAAQIEMRDVIIKSYQNDIDDLAANFIWEFNRAYSQTRGLESFSSLKALNAPVDPSVTLDKLTYNDRIRAGTFEITNGEFQIIIHNRNDDQPKTVRVEIDLDGRNPNGGEPDTILWDPDNPAAENSLVNRIQKALDAEAPGVFEVRIDNEYHISIVSKSDEYGFCFGKDTSGVLAALGMNVLFTGHNAANMGINQELKDNPSLLGGAYSFMKGDNDGISDLLDLRDKTLGNLKEMTLELYYQSITGRLASEANRTTNMKKLSTDVINSMFIQRESLSGVNEDEEVTKMITYQRAFQSAAKFISVVDQLYETLINM